MRKRVLAFLSFVGASLWLYFWEFLRSIFYERAEHVLGPILSSHSDVLLGALVQYGPPVVLVVIGLILFVWSGRRSSDAPTPADTVGRTNKAATDSGPLQINVGESGPFTDVPKRNLYGFTKRFKIEVRNIDRSKTASNCKIQITKIEPESGYRGPWILKEGFALPAGDQIYIPIAQYKQAEKPETYNCADTFIKLCTEGKAPSLQIETENAITIRATALDSSFSEVQCKLWVDEAGQLRIKNARAPSSKDRLDEIGRLRTKETQLRNTPVRTQAEFEKWKSDFDALREEIARNIQQGISIAEAERFKTVGNLRVVAVGFNREHSKLVAIATRDLDHIDDLISAYSHKGLT